MRSCMIWLTEMVDEGTEVIMDTSAMSEREWRQYAGRMARPPRNEVLVLVHPLRYAKMRACVTTAAQAEAFQDPLGRALACAIVDLRCGQNRELSRRLRWNP